MAVNPRLLHPSPGFKICPDNKIVQMDENQVDVMHKKEKKFTMTDWMWLWCYNFSIVIPRLTYGKELIINSNDGSERLSLKKAGNDVKIKLLTGFYKDGKYTPENKETTAPFNEFLEEILQLLERFTKEMKKINPKVVENPEFRQIIEGQEKIREMLYK
jgi:hypothetical protein